MCCQLQLLLQSVLFHFYWSFENATSEWPWVCTAKVESSNDFVCSYKFYRKFECAIGLDAIGTPYNIIIVEDVCFNVCLFQEIRNSETPNGFGKVWRVSVYARFVLWLYDSVSLWHCSVKKSSWLSFDVMSNTNQITRIFLVVLPLWPYQSFLPSAAVVQPQQH